MARRVLASGVAAALSLGGAGGCRRPDAAAPEQMEARIAALERERDVLRARVAELMTRDPRLAGVPDAALRVGVPTTLARTLVQRVMTGFVDQVNLRLADLKVHKAGTVRKVVTIGDYRVDIAIHEVSGRLETGEPDVRFGGNEVTVALPVRIAEGSGRATVDFDWDGKNVSGGVCGDLHVRQEVSGSVKPARYPVRGSLRLTTTAAEILAAPRFPRLAVNLKVEPSPESWAAVQKILEEKKGLCGFVLDKVDVRHAIEELLARGFDVRLPTEKLKPMAVPVGIASTMTVGDKTITLVVKVAGLTITEDMIWLGADVSLGRTE